MPPARKSNASTPNPNPNSNPNHQSSSSSSNSNSTSPASTPSNSFRKAAPKNHYHPYRSSNNPSSSTSKRSRKFTAIKAPSPSSTASSTTPSPSTRSSSSSPSSPSSSISSSLISIISLDSSSYPSSLRSLVLSLTNDRYPGAPGTALYKAREANERELARQKREKKKLEQRKEELERLGIDINGVVVGTTPSASANGSGPTAQVGSAKRARRSTPVANLNGNGNGKKNGGSNRRTPNLSNSLDPDSLPTAMQNQDQPNSQPQGITRTRRPASRGSSPSSIISNSNHKDDGNNEENHLSSRLNSASSRGASPDSSRTNSSNPSSSSSASSNINQPYQSSPLARDVTSANFQSSPTEEKGSELGGTRPLKRKASALAHEITYQNQNGREKSTENGHGDSIAVGQESSPPKRKVNKGTGGEKSNDGIEIQPPSPPAPSTSSSSTNNTASNHHTGTSPSPLLRAAIHSSPLASTLSDFNHSEPAQESGKEIDPLVVIEGESENEEDQELLANGIGTTKDRGGRKRVPPKRLEGFHQPVRKSVGRNTSSPAPPATNPTATGSSSSSNPSTNPNPNSDANLTTNPDPNPNPNSTSTMTSEVDESNPSESNTTNEIGKAQPQLGVQA